MAEKEAAERFWGYALSIYEREAARDAFLRLQDRDGADVPMLLWCMWCAHDGGGGSPETMDQAIAFSDAWQRAAVYPLRTLRRDLKPGVDGVSPSLSESARGKIAATEQAVERLQMDHLATYRSEGPYMSAREQVALYARVAGLSLDESDVAIILESV